MYRHITIYVLIITASVPFWGRFQCNLLAASAAKIEKAVVHRIAITGYNDLVFKDGDNPCKVLKKYCKAMDTDVVTKEACFAQLHPLVVKQITGLWEQLRNRLKVDAGFFMDCEPFKFKPSDYTVDARTSHADSSESMTTRNSSGIIVEMLLLLERAMQRDVEALQTFNIKRNELKLTDLEKIDLYRQAILLLPNNLFIVDQLGLALMFIDREDLARLLWSNAVARDLWGNPLQRPVSRYVPGLTSKPWHDPKDYPFIARLEGGYSDIKNELLYNMENRQYLFTEEQENLHIGGDWTELRLRSSGYGFTKETQYFPKTMKYIRECGQDFTSIKFSAIQPGTHIRTHTGPSNERLRVHLTLMHSGGAKIRVGTVWHTWIQGKAIIFDDSWEHEVIHTGTDMRVVLILDIWHPELPESQRIAH